jgi:cell division protein FtsL
MRQRSEATPCTAGEASLVSRELHTVKGSVGRATNLPPGLHESIFVSRNDPNSETTTLYRNLILVLLLASVALIVHNIFGQNGYLALRRQLQERQKIQQEILQFKQQNEQLEKENQELRTNPAAIERKAREQMHLVKPGEKIYSLPDKPPVGAPAPPARTVPPQP